MVWLYRSPIPVGMGGGGYFTRSNYFYLPSLHLTGEGGGISTMWLVPTHTSYYIYSRGLQFYTFFGISIGIKRRLIDIAKKITFYFLQNVWKCTVFFAYAFKVCKKCYYDPKKFFLEEYQYGYQKNAEFYADFKFVDAGFQKCP